MALSAVGIATITKVKKPSQLLFACIPIFFALQQFAEGILWLTFANPGYLILQKISTQVFIVMAQVIWPALVPFSVFLLEKNRKRKILLVALSLGGLIVALIGLYYLVFYPVQADISYRHLVYQNNSQGGLSQLDLAVYFTVTVGPLLVSSIKRMDILGLIMGLSFMVSALFYIQCLTSVWCFFAAAISFVIYFIERDLSRREVA